MAGRGPRGAHGRIVGLVASHVRERTQRPVVALAPERDGWLKGSARSVAGLHLRDTLADVAARDPGLLERFGGHAAAAGLSLEASKLERFRQAFNEAVRERLGNDPPSAVIWSDGALESTHLQRDTAELLSRSGPWGQGFPEPVFDDQFEVLDCRVAGERHLRLTLRPADSRRTIGAIAFGAAEHHCPTKLDRLHLAYKLQLNTYRGSTSLQLLVEHIES